MWLLFLPIVVLVGLLFVMGSAVFWVLGSAWPVLLICLGAWLFWNGDGRHRQRKKPRHGDTLVRVAPSSRRQPVVTPDRPTQKPELPIDIEVKVEQIRRKVDVLLGFADRFPPFSKDLYLVRQTASEYLPRTIDTFLGLSREAIDQPVVTGGRTARDELKSQLDLLDKKLDEIAQDLQRQDSDRLLANRRFLEARFGAAAKESGAA